MIIYHDETQQSYEEWMNELEVKGCKWRGGEKPTKVNEIKKCGKKYGEKYGKEYGKEICVYEEDGEISFSDVEYFKKNHSDETLIEYKEKGENNESLSC